MNRSYQSWPVPLEPVEQVGKVVLPVSLTQVVEPPSGRRT